MAERRKLGRCECKWPLRVIMISREDVRDEASDRKRGSSGVSISLCSAPTSIEHLNFSTCGSQVILKHHGQPFQDVLSIQSNSVYQEALIQCSQQQLLKTPSRTHVDCNRHVEDPNRIKLHNPISSNDLGEIITERQAQGVELTSTNAGRELRINRFLVERERSNHFSRCHMCPVP